MPVRVAVLAGGLSLERDVSLRSGHRVAEALEDRGHSVTRLDLDDQLVPGLVNGDYDAVYLALHGKAGEDGTIQGLLELIGLPYTGPDAVASGLAWDKVVAKGMFRRGGVLTPDWVALSIDAIRDMGAVRALDRVVDRLGTPVVVKPAHGGAALGVHLVPDAGGLPAALVAAYSYDDVVLIERFVEGMEVAVSIVGGEILPVVEIAPKTGPYDFAARYTHGATQFHAPARLPQDTLAACATAGETAWRLAGCRHVTRADMIVDASGRPWLLELDTCPGMTETSLLPMAAAARGWSFPDLCERILQDALASADLPAGTAAAP